ncbi:MAG: hypothetical protein Fur0042_09400 [Cyanophyceae cyanobacterium]
MAEEAHHYLHGFLRKSQEDLLKTLFLEGIQIHFLEEGGDWKTSHFKAAILPIWDLSDDFLENFEADLAERILQFEENLYFQASRQNEPPEATIVERAILEGQPYLLEDQLIKADPQWAICSNNETLRSLCDNETVFSVHRFLEKLKSKWFNPVQGYSIRNMLDYHGTGRALIPGLPWLDGKFRVQLILFRVIPENSSGSIAAVDEEPRDYGYESPLDEFRQGEDTINQPGHEDSENED